MQTGINALAAIVAAAPPQASGSSASAEDADGAPLGQQFSQLLSDSGKQQAGEQSSQQALAAKILHASTASALSAQEVVNPAEQLAQLLASREQMISPEDAKDLLKRVDAMASQATGAADAQALSQVKNQLQDIINTGTPKSIADILAAATALKDSKLSLVGLTALLASTGGKNAEMKSTEHANSDEEGETPAMASQAVPVMVFRPDAGEAKANSAAAKSDKEKESVKDDDLTDASASADNAAASGLVTVMIPLAASITQVVAPAPVANTAVATDISIKDTMPPPALKPRSDIDQVIPPLTSNDGDEDSLPQVNLPKAGSIEQANAAKVAQDNAQSTNAAASADAAKLADDKQANAKQQADLTAINGVSQPSGTVSTQTVSAVQPVNVVQTPGYINHAPVSEQVSVGITKAAKDGIDHITIQLDPAGLGRVEVSLHTNRDGQTQISFTVDKADTFDNLSRDARHLERSLQEAGIKADTSSMQFNMRQQPQPQLQSDMGNGQGRPQQQANAEDAGTVATTSIASIMPAVTSKNYLFNVREGVDISA